MKRVCAEMLPKNLTMSKTEKERNLFRLSRKVCGNTGAFKNSCY
jgi:hypothetical protein